MLANIRDHRKRPYRWVAISAIVEATAADNSVDDADVAEEGEAVYAEMRSGTLAEAIAWAQTFAGPTTLYLYDLGEGIEPRRSPEPQVR